MVKKTIVLGCQKRLDHFLRNFGNAHRAAFHSTMLGDKQPVFAVNAHRGLIPGVPQNFYVRELWFDVAVQEIRGQNQTRKSGKHEQNDWFYDACGSGARFASTVAASHSKIKKVFSGDRKSTRLNSSHVK